MYVYVLRGEKIQSQFFKVVFVDYGNMEVVKFTSLKQLPVNLATLPIQVNVGLVEWSNSLWPAGI